jgi:hypothetical protein
MIPTAMLKLFAKWLLTAFVVLTGLYLCGTVIGLILPAVIDVSDSIVINRPAENVWWVLTDYSNAPLWHPQYKNAGPMSLPGDKPTRWRATYTDGYTVNVEVKEEIFPTHLVEQISDRNLPFSGGWTVDLVRIGEQCRVTAHSRAEIHWPIDRLFVRWFLRPRVELDRILAGLKQRVEATTVKPSPATS